MGEDQGQQGEAPRDHDGQGVMAEEEEEKRGSSLAGEERSLWGDGPDGWLSS